MSYENDLQFFYPMLCLPEDGCLHPESYEK